MPNFLNVIVASNRNIFLTLCGLVLAGYAVMLQSPFKTLDDDFSIVNNKEIRSLHHIPSYFSSTYFKTEHDYYRPLVYVSYAIEYHFFRLNHFFYNLDNVLLHALNAWLVFLIALWLLSDRLKAFSVSLLFAIHPIHWEAVGNVSGRAILLCAFFVLSGLWFFMRFLREKRRRFLAVTILCYVFGLLSKESAGVLVLVAGLLVLTGWGNGLKPFPTQKSPSLRSKVLEWIWVVPFGIVAVGYLYIRHLLGITKVFPWPTFAGMALGVATFLKGLLIYLSLLVVPVSLHFDRGLVMYKTFLSPGLWSVGALWLALLVTFVVTWRRWPWVGIFCVGWFFIEMFPVSQIVTSIGVYPGAISLADHFVYVASIPFLILFVTAVWHLAKNWKLSANALQLAAAGFAVFFIITLIGQNIYASNEYHMLRDSLARDPKNSRLQYSMGLVYVKAKNYPLAVEHFQNAVTYDAQNDRYRIALGKALTDSGRYLEAARAYDPIVARDDLKDILKTNKEEVYGHLVNDYLKKIEIAPGDADLHFALGIFYTRLDNKLKALSSYQEAFRLRPDFDDALFNVAVTSEALGDRGSALTAYRDLLTMGSSKPELRKMASERLAALGQN